MKRLVYSIILLSFFTHCITRAADSRVSEQACATPEEVQRNQRRKALYEWVKTTLGLSGIKASNVHLGITDITKTAFLTGGVLECTLMDGVTFAISVTYGSVLPIPHLVRAANYARAITLHAIQTGIALPAPQVAQAAFIRFLDLDGHRILLTTSEGKLMVQKKTPIPNPGQ